MSERTEQKYSDIHGDPGSARREEGRNLQELEAEGVWKERKDWQLLRPLTCIQQN
jgi:hypothetical protein